MDYIEHILNSSDPHQLNLCIEDAIDWAVTNGLIIRTKEHPDSSGLCQIAPFTLLPSPFPHQLFDQALSVQESMNLLYFKISWDYEFLVESHKDVIKSDEFTREMLQILQTIFAEGIKQKITLLTQRADYMCHVDEFDKSRNFQLKQIEVNNIAVSMGGLALRATNLHRHVLNKLGRGDAANCRQTIPDNEPIKTLAKGIYTAWKLFGDKNAITLVVVGEVNQNQFDQRYIEWELEGLSGGQMQIMRLTLTESAEKLKLDENYSLILNGKPVAIVYFRAGYSPEDYCSRREWDARLMMERSTAIKCPWIGLQLANTKKIQQVLSVPGVLEKFFDPNQKDVVNSVRRTFAMMWGLEREDEKTLEIIKDAISNPHKYVLKPQLEGGGGNYFGQEVADKLREFSPEQRASHILMQKITPLVVKNYLVRALQKVELKNVVSELGIYGYLIGDGEDLTVKCNETGGHILRSKLEHETKGGVAIGAAVIDTPFLI